LKGRITDEAKVTQIEERINRELEQAVEFAKNSPEPSVEEFLQSVINV
jgi:TPP-dependent pyruvate/acetoin dehydrogenase alpha subunit